MSHLLVLSLVILKGAGWSVAEVADRQQKIASIFAQCGIEVRSNITEVDAPNGWIDVDSQEEDRDGTIARLLKDFPRPAIFYVRSSLQGETGYSWYRSMKASPELHDTAWITQEVVTTSYLKTVRYLIDAHE